jgi:hypothetical protein
LVATSAVVPEQLPPPSVHVHVLSIVYDVGLVNRPDQAVTVVVPPSSGKLKGTSRLRTSPQRRPVSVPDEETTVMSFPLWITVTV